MPNVIVDPSFEIGDPAWSLTGLAAFSQNQAHTGVFSLQLGKKFSGFNTQTGVADQAVPCADGDVVPVSLWVNGDEAIFGASTLKVSMSDVIGLQAEWTLPLPVPAGWFLWQPGSFTAHGTWAQFECRTIGLGIGNENWYIDDVSVVTSIGGAVARSRWTATQALIALLQGINGGSTYHLNVGSRVYSKLITPFDNATMVMPYICVPLLGDAPRWDNDNNYLVCRWTQDLYLFANETQANVMNSDAARDLYYLVEDVLKVLLANQTLSGTVQAVAIMNGGGGIAGVLDDNNWGEYRLPIELTVYFGLDTLGP